MNSTVSKQAFPSSSNSGEWKLKKEWLENKEITLQAKLEQLPSLIAFQAEIAINANSELRKAWLLTETEEAKIYLEAEGLPSKTREMKARASPQVIKAKTDEIFAEASYRIEQLRHSYYENKFIALRKLASLMETEMKTSIHNP